MPAHALSLRRTAARNLCDGRHRGERAILGQPMADEPVAIGMRRGEEALRRHVDQALLALDRQGRIDAIWNHWLGPGTVYDMSRDDWVMPIEALRFTALP